MGLKCKLQGGYDRFKQSHFNKINLKYGDFKEYNNIALEHSITMGMIWGKNIQQNDLLNRNYNRWVGETCQRFINGRLSLLIKKFGLLGGIIDGMPYLYI